MKKVAILLVLVLALAAYGHTAETGIGVSAMYPLFWLGDLYSDSYEVDMSDIEIDDLMFGVDLRYKWFILLVDTTVYAPVSFSRIIWPIDVGLCFDLWLLRLGVAGGITAAYIFDAPSFEDGLGWVPNIKANVDVKLGDLTVGVSAYMAFYIPEATRSIYNEFGLVGSSGISVNLLYWFGSKDSKSDE